MYCFFKLVQLKGGHFILRWYMWDFGGWSDFLLFLPKKSENCLAPAPCRSPDHLFAPDHCYGDAHNPPLCRCGAEAARLNL